MGSSDRLVTAVTNHGLTLVPCSTAIPPPTSLPINPAQFAAWPGNRRPLQRKSPDFHIIWDEPNLTRPLGRPAGQRHRICRLISPLPPKPFAVVDPDAVILHKLLALTQKPPAQSSRLPFIFTIVIRSRRGAAFDVAAASHMVLILALR
ncbi:MAG: hypothetical protein H6669_04905 [Ardenticatenaceae bacterium]|nr:hypothetical protein [Ardenticatenaceae bacterium]